MGNDGGVVAVKRKFMRHANQKTKSEKVDQEVRRLERAQTCAISGEPLQEPIVACELGNLYNKQALLERLLAKTVPERFQHISSLKDVVSCRFSRGENATEGPFSCPVTMVEFNGKQPFVLPWSCGCVVSERAMKEVQTKECLVCNKSIENAAIVALLPAEELYADAQKTILERKAIEKQQKKDGKKKSDKKRHERQEEEEDADGKRKDKKQHKRGRHSAVETSRSSGDKATASIAQEAAAAMEQAKSTNKVFASLFSKDKSDKKPSANDLLMTVGGMRYSLS